MTEPVNTSETVKRYIIHYDGRGEQEHPSGDFVHYMCWKAQSVKREAAESRSEEALAEVRRVKDESLKLERTMIEATKEVSDLKELLQKVWKHHTSEYANKEVEKAVEQRIIDELNALGIK